MTPNVCNTFLIISGTPSTITVSSFGKANKKREMRECSSRTIVELGFHYGDFVLVMMWCEDNRMVAGIVVVVVVGVRGRQWRCSCRSSGRLGEEEHQRLKDPKWATIKIKQLCGAILHSKEVIYAFFIQTEQQLLTPIMQTNLQPISAPHVRTSIKIVSTLNESYQTNQQPLAGKIKRLVLTQEGRTKLNIHADREFYAYPRFVTHVDDGFISTLANLYRERLRPDTEILDLMSSWVSHLPNDVKYKRVVGHGLNAQELAKNPRLDFFVVKDLNKDQQFEFESCSFDAVLCTVSVQYLQQPEKVFEEVFRLLKPGGVFIVSFSNRMFYEKAISAWREGTAYSRVRLVVQYFQSVEGFTEPEVVRKLPNAQENLSPIGWIMRLLGMLSGSDPFYAVIAYRNFKPIHED
ncbi:methyltransferase protein [Spatholobus suberectus]|nr:methyltransferase protein [Spatholobus suberectus]